jgi:hypothetical protein
MAYIETYKGYGMKIYRINVEDVGKVLMVHFSTTFHPISLVGFYVCHSFFDT